MKHESTARLVASRAALNSDGFEVVQNEYTLTPAVNGFTTVVVSHVDPADGCDPTGVHWGETLDSAAKQPTYEAYKVHTANREYFREEMSDLEALKVMVVL